MAKSGKYCLCMLEIITFATLLLECQLLGGPSRECTNKPEILQATYYLSNLLRGGFQYSSCNPIPLAPSLLFDSVILLREFISSLVDFESA